MFALSVVRRRRRRWPGLQRGRWYLISLALGHNGAILLHLGGSIVPLSCNDLFPTLAGYLGVHACAVVGGGGGGGYIGNAGGNGSPVCCSPLSPAGAGSSSPLFLSSAPARDWPGMRQWLCHRHAAVSTQAHAMTLPQDSLVVEAAEATCHQVEVDCKAASQQQPRSPSRGAALRPTFRVQGSWRVWFLTCLQMACELATMSAAETGLLALISHHL